MNNRLRNGKVSELIVAAELTRHGLDIYMPLVDDQAIDMIIRQDLGSEVVHYDVQIKSVAGYNRIIGLKDIEAKSATYILVIHYRHVGKPDECLYLTRDQILIYHKKEYTWGDLIFNKAERDNFKYQTMSELAARIKSDMLVDRGQDIDLSDDAVNQIRRHWLTYQVNVTDDDYGFCVDQLGSIENGDQFWRYDETAASEVNAGEMGYARVRHGRPIASLMTGVHYPSIRQSQSPDALLRGVGAAKLAGDGSVAHHDDAVGHAEDFGQL